MKKYGSESGTKVASKFLPDMGEKEITDLLIEACEKSQEWIIEPNGVRSSVINMGRVIGTQKNTGDQTPFLKIVLKGITLYTAYPF